MAMELLPDGKTFKKLTTAQTKAMDRYYKRSRGAPERFAKMALPASLIIVGGMGALVYVFKDEMKAWVDDNVDDFVDWLKGLPKAAAVATGGGVADVIVTAGAAVTEAVGAAGGPTTPEYLTVNGAQIGPLSICQRWENDAVDWLALVQAKPSMSGTEKTVAALAAKRIIKGMKDEGCPKPRAFTQAQWDD